MIIENNGRKIIIGKNIPESPELPVESAPENPREILYTICQTISEGGYNPVSQLVGYITSEDPTHISNYKNARTLMSKIDVDELLESMVSAYIEGLKLEFGDKDTEDNDN